MLDLAHVGRLRVAIEELPHRLAGVVTGLGRSLARNHRGRGAARDGRASGPPVHAGSWALPSLLLHIERCLLDWCDFMSGQVRSNPLLQRKRRATARRSTPEAGEP